MSQAPKKKNHARRPYGRLALAALMTSGILQPLAPALAIGTQAGQDIINKATATFKDPSGQDYTVTSNEVTIKVAEVAGLTNTPVGAIDSNGGVVEANDEVKFTFEVTNTGNNTTKVFIPAATDLTTTGLQSAGLTVEYSTDGGTTYNARPADGIVTGVAPDTSILVRVTGKVQSTLSPGDKIYVILGNTGANDNTAGTQNQPDDSDSATETEQAKDVRTFDGSPVNGQREASAKSDELSFADSVKPLALTQVTKVNTLVQANDTTKVNDDQISYELGLNVKDQPNDKFKPAALEGTPIKLNGTLTARILVSDSLPDKTKLESVDFAALPSGWQVVYTTDALTKAPVVDVVNDSTGANAANWQVLNAGDPIPATVKRIGFINAGSITPNKSVAGFKFTINTSGYTATDTQAVVANIAQGFGQTVGDPNDEVVYDESGDANPNNFDGTTPPDASGTNYNPSVDGSGQVTDVEATGVDTGNNNQGSGAKGEANVVTINTSSAFIFNGPKGNPTAVGPNDNNDDFSNRSSKLADNIDVSGIGGAATIDPSAVGFTNTVNNPSASASLSQVTLEPLTPAEANTASGTTGHYGLDTDIPDGTRAVVSYDPDGVPNSGDERKAVYEYNLTGSEGAWEPVNSFVGTVQDATFTPVNIGTLNASRPSVDYKVTINLPPGQPILQDYTIPVVAFPDNNVLDGVGDGYTGEAINNITINRVYTGFMKMVKEARLLDQDAKILDPADGKTVLGDGNTNTTLGWTTAFGAIKIEPGQLIEYRISYENISEKPPAGAAGNSVLVANDFTIQEDGKAGSNNWATLMPGTTTPITVHRQKTTASNGTIQYFNGSTLIGASDPIDNYSVSRYDNVVGPVSPQGKGTFTFRRMVSNTATGTDTLP